MSTIINIISNSLGADNYFVIQINGIAVTSGHSPSLIDFDWVFNFINQNNLVGPFVINRLHFTNEEIEVYC